MRKISTALLLLSLVFNTHAQAGHKEDCDSPEYTQQYAAGFDGRLNRALEKFKDQDKHYRARMDGMKAALIKAGAWTEAEASVFMVKATMVDDDAKALEAGRKKAAGDFKIQLLSLDGIPMIAGGDKAAELRATCLLGPDATAKADVLSAATEKAWKLLESKILLEAQAKNVTLP
jgi:hypothetical protein